MIVPPNWLGGLKTLQPLKPGIKTALLIYGRDISFDYAAGLRLEVDDPALLISNIHWQDASTIAADIQVEPTIRPGDYLVHVYAGEKELKLPGGNRIQVTP